MIKLMNKNFYYYILSFFLYSNLFLLSSIKAEIDTGNSFALITPSSIIAEIEKINENQNAEIPYRIGKFGDVPFGKSVLGMVFIQTQIDGTNYWCDYDLTSTPNEIKTYSSIYSEYLPIILVDQGQCSYSKKALNVQLRGGAGMLIVDDDNNLDNNEKYNILDLRGNSIKIPTLIIPRKYGDLIKDYIQMNKATHISQFEPVIASIKFSAFNPDGTIEMNLFMSSDDLNAIHFFNEFKKYKEQLGDKFKFSPIYKYHNYKLYESNNDAKNKENYPCFTKKDIYFCSTKNADLNIENPRYVLLENLRQSCIFITLGLDDYWNYMIEFGKNCANLKNPLFNEECSYLSFLQLKYKEGDYNLIKGCMQDLIDFNSKVDDDYQLFNDRKVYEYPLITLNGIQFKGMWLPRTIFNSICTSFINDEEICGSPKAKNISTGKMYPSSLMFFIISFLFLFTLILVICYRRVAYRSIEQTIIEKIQTETVKSIGKRRKKNNEKDKLNEDK